MSYGTTKSIGSPLAATLVPDSGRYHKLTTRVIRLSLFNLLVVSGLGVLLRAAPFFDSFPLDYKNVLHGHSHFAFGGWVMPMLMALLLKTFPDLTKTIAFKHWRNITLLLFGSAYGMLLSFPVQGYKAVSLFFSTLSVAAGFYLIVVLWKRLNKTMPATSARFLKAGLFYLGVSALGPFATGPLVALGYQGTPLYFDAIYFYLHFQYNGWFTFAVLALLYKLLEQSGSQTRGRVVFHLLNVACIPAFALSVLWNKPPLVFNVMGGAAALLQVVAFFFLLRDLPVAAWKKSWSGRLYLIAMAAFGLKVVLQLASAFPEVALLGFVYRNFIIAYLHLVLLGFISVFFIALVCTQYGTIASNVFKAGVQLFLFSFLTTESLLVVNACRTLFQNPMPHDAEVLLLCSCCFPVGILLMGMGFSKRLQQQTAKTPLPATPYIVV